MPKDQLHSRVFLKDLMKGMSKYALVGASLVIFALGVYFNSTPALVISTIYVLVAIIDVEMTRND